MIEKPKCIIKKISASETYKVRHPVLRTGKPIESCIFDGDEHENTFHLGLYIENKLAAVASFLKNNNPLIIEKHQYQLRGMAVIEEFQKKGLGKDILNFAESLLKQENTEVIWCNAREIAVNFYKNCNYKIIGNTYTIKNIGLHYTMYKNIKTKKP